MADHADANLPPEPAERHISPAYADYEDPPAIRNLLWPVVWMGIAALCWMAASSLGWIEWTH